MGTVATLLAEHVSFRCTSVDRIGIRGYVPSLQYEGGVVRFLLKRGNHIPSPAAARSWFEAAIAGHLDLGRPERVSLVVDRRIVNRGKHKTPGRFATEVITRDVVPQLQIHYESSKAKAYLKEGRALRAETTVNNADDFGLHKTLTAENWRVLRRLGAATNARFLAAIGEGSARPARPRHLGVGGATHHPRRPAGAGPALGDPRVMALLASAAAFAHVIGGLTNKILRAHMTVHWHPDYTSAQASYDLRRLRLKRFIERIDGTNTYRVTMHGLRIAAFFTQLASRVVVPRLTDLAALGRPRKSAPPSLAAAWGAYERQLKILLRRVRLVA